MGSPAKISVKEIRFFERDVILRLPFRFGIVTLREAPQIFVQAIIEDDSGRQTAGYSAEVLAPKWFDKNPELSNEQNFDDLRRAAGLAAARYTSGGPATPFGHFANHYSDHMGTCAEDGMEPLVASFGQAVLDRAVLDAVCRASKISFYQAVQENLIGLERRDGIAGVANTDFNAFLAALRPAATIQARHTVGMLDPLDHNPDPVGDGLPETLVEVIRTYGHTYFKLKVGGDIGQDLDRLTAIARILDRELDHYWISLDGNEQFDDTASFLDFFNRLESQPALARMFENMLFIEQPIARAKALATDISAVAAKKPVIVDESDGEIGVFPEAVALGYGGVSSKSCKGLYKSMINLARCKELGGGYFLSGEDLTMQAGLAVQQDLALVNLLGLTHLERNGHHYVYGFYGVSEVEQQAFLAAHGDLYVQGEKAVRLNIEGGAMQIASLACPGFASAALPDLAAMRRVDC